jgi:hypothetical protein
MDALELILSSTPSLIHLKVISSRRKLDSAFDGSVWERIIETKLPSLKNLQLFFNYTFCHGDSSPALESIITPFQTTFWANKKHWDFSIDYDLKESILRLYTTPICKVDPIYEYIRCSLSSKDNKYSIVQQPKRETYNSKESQVY